MASPSDHYRKFNCKWNFNCSAQNKLRHSVYSSLEKIAILLRNYYSLGQQQTRKKQVNGRLSRWVSNFCILTAQILRFEFFKMKCYMHFLPILVVLKRQIRIVFTINLCCCSKGDTNPFVIFVCANHPSAPAFT